MHGGVSVLVPTADWIVRDDDVLCGAEFSDCRTWRYALYRVWDEALPRLGVFALNPSIADEVNDDRTVSRLQRFARDWGYGGLNMGNIFAFCATQPRVMKKAENPVGPENDVWLERLATDSALMLAAWGVNGRFRHRDRQVLARFRQLRCLSVTKYGFPRHPLYVPGDTRHKQYP